MIIPVNPQKTPSQHIPIQDASSDKAISRQQVYLWCMLHMLADSAPRYVEPCKSLVCIPSRVIRTMKGLPTCAADGIPCCVSPDVRVFAVAMNPGRLRLTRRWD